MQTQAYAEILVKIEALNTVMPSKSIHLQLREIFSASDKEKWKKIASQEIEGKNPFENLSWKSEDGIEFFPYYDKSDVAHLKYLDEFSLAVAEDAYFGPRKWLNVPRVKAEDAIRANHAALAHLANGADGIFFDNPRPASIDALLKKIEWPYCSLYFFSDTPADVLKQLLSLSKKENLDSGKLNGALFWDNHPKNEIDHHAFPNFKFNGIYISPSTSLTEISSALIKGVQALEQADSKEKENIFRSICFSLPLSANFLESIAKLKSLRNLWFQVSQAYGFKKYSPSDLHIHARTESWTPQAFQPHGNMLKSTTASMASIIGGADALTVFAEEDSNETMNRIARNVQSVLREESHLDRVADPLAGAYALEVMIDNLSREAWKLFQSNI